MVPIMRLFRNLPALFALVCATTGQGADSIYRKVGDSVVLNPGQPFNAISSATWKHNTDLASEWFGTGNVDCYRDFKGRCSLNTTDGSFTISNLKVEDSGIYTPEINDKVLTALKLQVIEPVPKPTVSVKCNYEETLCNLICEAKINPDVGTVKYEWRTGEEVLSNDKKLIITTENKESSFICELENPVSSSSSDGVDNPLSRGNPVAGAVIGSLIVAVVLAVVGYAVYYWHKKGNIPSWKGFWCCDKKRANGQYTNVSTQDSETKTNNYEPNGGWPIDTVQNVNENEGEASPRVNEEKDASEKPKDPDCDPSIVSAEVSIEPDQDGDEGKTWFLANDKVPSSLTEGEASPRDKEEKDYSETKTNIYGPSGKWSTDTVQNVNENEKKLLHDASKKSDLEAKTSNDQEPNGRRSTETVQTVKENEDEAPPRDTEEKDASEKPKDPDCDPSIVSAEVSIEPDQDGDEGKTWFLANDKVPSGPTEDNDSPNNGKKTDDQHKESAEESPIENQGDSSAEKQTTKASETNTSKNHEHNGGGPADAVQNVNENEAKNSSSNNKKTDDPDQKLAEESSSENQVDSNTGEQPFNGTENTSETPSGPETSEQGSADQDQS